MELFAANTFSSLHVRIPDTSSWIKPHGSSVWSVSRQVGRMLGPQVGPLLWRQAERVGVVQPGEDKLWRDLIAAFQYLKGAYRKDGEGLFTRAWSDGTRGNGLKLKEGRFRLDVRKKFFRMRVVRHWNRLPREAVNAPSLEVFKTRLDGALGNLV